MKFYKYFFMVGVLVFSLMTGLTSSASESSGPLEKLGRGVANIGFGGLEMIIRPLDVAKEKGNVAALTYGVFKGLSYTIARVVIGVVDIGTFLVPLPGCTDDPEGIGWGYGPILRPAWVVDTEHNAYNLFYQDQTLVETY